MKENLFTTLDTGDQVNTLFSLRGPFSSVNDIKDSSNNALTISRVGSVSVGSDTDGSYINIPAGNNHYISFGGAPLNGPNTIIELSVKYMTSDVSSGMLIYDTRPASSNGNYSFMSVWANSYQIRLPPTQNNTNGTNSGQISSGNRLQVKTNLRLEYLSDKSYFYEDDVLIRTLPTVFTHLNQVYKIGYHSFNGSTNTVRLYSFKVYKRY